jgi:hypothetical protein
MDVDVRGPGLCLILAGVLTLPTVAHPDILEIGLAEAVRAPAWTPIHAAGLAVVVLSLAGVAGLALLHRGSWGRLGVVAVAVTVVGLVAAAGLTAIEAIIFPAIARSDPGLLGFDGPIAGTAGFWALAGMAALWLLGEGLVGVAVARAGLLPRAPAVLLALGAFSFVAFEGPFVPLLGPASVVLLSAGQVWLGAALFRAAQSPETSTPGSSRSRRSAEMR